jgi:hypothetical protein
VACNEYENWLQEALLASEASKEQMQRRNNELEEQIASMAERAACLQANLLDGKHLNDELQARLNTMVDRGALWQVCNERDLALRELLAEQETFARTEKQVARLQTRADTTGMIARAAYDEACRALHELEDLHASMVSRHQQDLEHIATEVARALGAHDADRSIQTQNSISTILKEIDVLQRHVQTLKSGHAETVALMQLRIDALESTVAIMVDPAVHELVCHERDAARANLSALQTLYDMERAHGPFTGSPETVGTDILVAKLHSIVSHLHFLGDASETAVDSRLCEAALALMEAAEALEASGLGGGNLVTESSVCATFLVELSTRFRSALRISKQLLIGLASSRHESPLPSRPETLRDAVGAKFDSMHAELHSLRGELGQTRKETVRASTSMLEGRRRLDIKRDAWEETMHFSKQDVGSPFPSQQLRVAQLGACRPLGSAEKALKSTANQPLLNLVLLRRAGHTDQVDIQLVPQAQQRH